MIITRHETEVGGNTLVRMSGPGMQVHCVAPNNHYVPKLGVILKLPLREALNIDWSDSSEDEGPEIDFSIDVFTMQRLVELFTKVLEEKPWK